MTTSPEPTSRLETMPVIVVGGQARMVVTLARSLGHRGIPVVHVTTGAAEGRAPSRYLREVVTMPSWLESPERFERALIDVVKRWPGSLLLPLSDSAMVVLGRIQGRLPASCRVGCPPSEITALILDKARTAEIAGRLGIPMPRDFAVTSAAQLEAIASELTFPLLCKARDKIEHARRHGDADFGLRLHPDLASLRAAFAAEPDYGEKFVFQEYCPGHDVLLSMLMHEGRLVASFQARSLRTWPSTGGVTVLTRSEPVDPELCRQMETFLRAIGWEGIAQGDFRHVPETGRTVLLEINGRFWGSTMAAVHAGVDFPYYVWQLARGETPAPPASYRTGLVTRWLMSDLKRLLRLWRAPAATESRLLETLKVIGAFRPWTKGMMWAWDDPVPAWSEWTDSVRWYLLTRARNFRHRVAAFGRNRRSGP